MLTEEAKLKWANYFAKQAEELNIPENQRNIFIQAALFGTHRYSLMLMKRLAKYGDDLMNNLDGDNWITDSSVRMFMQHLEPEEAQAKTNTNDMSPNDEPSAP